MAIFDTYAKRRRREAADGPDALLYEPIPVELRRQVIHIWREAIGPFIKNQSYIHADYAGNERWRWMHNTLAKEMGVFHLGDGKPDPFVQCQQFLLAADTDDALSIIELTFRFIDKVMFDMPDFERREQNLEQTAADAVEEMNGRFLEHNLGYRYENGQIVRIDSELLHREVTVPAIALLRDEGFDGPLQEFMNAHAHYRNGEIKDANVDALNSFESTLKAICDERSWTYAPGATASTLVQLVLKEELVPATLQSQFEHLVKTLETGLPPIRNKMGGHGQGAVAKDIDSHLGAYALHVLGATIVLLVEAHRAMR